MTPDEICEALAKIGADVSRRTLLHYEELELIPIPQRGGGGRKGRFTDYPEWTIEEAYAAWSLIHGKYAVTFFGGKPPSIPPIAIKHFRKFFYAEKEYVAMIDSLDSDAREAAPPFEDEYGCSLKYEFNSTKTYETNEAYEFSFLFSEAEDELNSGFRKLWQAERLKARLLIQNKEVPQQVFAPKKTYYTGTYTYNIE